MFTFRLSIFTSAFFLAALLLIPIQYSFSQDDISLGCCKTVKGNPSCVGCGEGDLKCAIDGSLCVETNSFTLDEMCIDSQIAEEAECRPAEGKSGCCVVSEDQCTNNVVFESCKGQHWFEGAECTSVPACSPPVATSGFVDWIILAGAFVIVLLLLIKFRRKRHGR